MAPPISATIRAKKLEKLMKRTLVLFADMPTAIACTIRV